MDRKTPRLVKVLDALSQLANVALLPDHRATSANESISGRSYRCGWTLAESLINAIFFWDRTPEGLRDHCRLAHMRDLERARKTLRAG